MCTCMDMVAGNLIRSPLFRHNVLLSSRTWSQPRVRSNKRLRSSLYTRDLDLFCTEVVNPAFPRIVYRIHRLNPDSINWSIATDPFFCSIAFSNCIARFANDGWNDAISPLHCQLFNGCQQLNMWQTKERLWFTLGDVPDWILRTIRPWWCFWDWEWSDPPARSHWEAWAQNSKSSLCVPTAQWHEIQKGVVTFLGLDVLTCRQICRNSP